MDKPWLLIDVDGPLNPFDAAWFPKGPAPDGWRIHHLMPQEYPDGLPVALNPLLGLPTDLPVVPLTRDRGSFVRRSWKTDQIAAWAGARPFAWIDDEVNRATRDWLRDNAAGPAFALRVEARTGLTPDHVTALRQARSVLAP